MWSPLDQPVLNSLVPPADDVADSLTRREWLGLMNTYNLADGHARQAQTPQMSKVVSRLPELYEVAGFVPQVTLQRQFEEAFYRLAGQDSVVTRERRPLHHYSSSLSVEVVANYLREKRLRVSLSYGGDFVHRRESLTRVLRPRAHAPR